MARDRVSVDMDHLMVALLSSSFPDADWATASDVDSPDRVPFGVVNSANGQMVSNGAAGLAFEWVVGISLVHIDQEVLGDWADEVWETIHNYHDSWKPESGMIVGIGAINSVEDISMFTRSATTKTPAGDLTQYDGTFSITVRKA